MRVRNVKNASSKIKEYPNVVIENYLEYKGKWKTLFKNDNPIYLEIGMGKGKFIIEHALRNPNINYIGFEKEESIVYKALIKVIEANMPSNLIIINADASNILDIFSQNEVSKVYLNFSDPWPKTRHEKRRLTGPIIFKNILSILDGTLEFKTDNRHLFEYSLMQFNQMKLKIERLSLNLHEDDEDIITTEYEDKFVSLGNPIYYCEIKEEK